MSNFGYERTLMGYLENLRTYMVTRPMTLGGVAGPGGGVGGPTGGFIGTLPQSRVSYDTTEAESLSTPLSGYSLVDNLNHIRGRIAVIEAGAISGIVGPQGPMGPSGAQGIQGPSGSGIGGGHIIQYSGASYTARSYLNFIGSSISITDDPANDRTNVIFTVTNGGGNDFTHNIDGALAVVSGVGAYVATKTLTISKVYLYGFDTGTSSSTIIDINKNGTTIFTNQANRPSLIYNDVDGVAISGIPDITTLVEGDVLIIDIDQAAVDSSGLAVVVGITSSGSGSTSSSPVDILAVQVFS